MSRMAAKRNLDMCSDPLPPLPLILLTLPPLLACIPLSTVAGGLLFAPLPTKLVILVERVLSDGELRLATPVDEAEESFGLNGGAQASPLVALLRFAGLSELIFSTLFSEGLLDPTPLSMARLDCSDGSPIGNA